MSSTFCRSTKSPSGEETWYRPACRPGMIESNVACTMWNCTPSSLPSAWYRPGSSPVIVPSESTSYGGNTVTATVSVLPRHAAGTSRASGASAGTLAAAGDAVPPEAELALEPELEPEPQPATRPAARQAAETASSSPPGRRCVCLRIAGVLSLSSLCRARLGDGFRELIRGQPQETWIRQQVRAGPGQCAGGLEHHLAGGGRRRGLPHRHRVAGRAERRDTDVRVDARQPLADIPDVRTARRIVRRRLAHFYAGGRQVPGHPAGDRMVVVAFFVQGRGLGDLHSRAGGERRGPGAVRDPCGQRDHAVGAGMTDQELGLGQVRYYVGGGAALGDHPVHPGPVADVLAERVGGDEELDDRGERVLALLRVLRRVRGHAAEPDTEVRAGQRPAPRDGAVGGMEHQRRVDSVEDACLQFHDLPAATFLPGRADHQNRPGRSPGQRADQGRRGGQAAGRDQVVPAAMTEPWQCIVFEQESEDRTAVTVRADERRLQSSDAACDGEALLIQPFGEQRRSLTLLERCLRFAVQPRAQIQRPARESADLSEDRLVQPARRSRCQAVLRFSHAATVYIPTRAVSIINATALITASENGVRN